ncbi:hypothetical protein CN264_19015 [Bacillus cereus]|uniref:HepT-like ribonuclease domain-containing protein n=1 Tax=Bacillus cereus TaxID=1396 RepID=UPI000BF51EA0|nr:HepT-like ribonuclease domain-containing protein [Bacillus cereus]PFC23500.1 hypothetical protein CN264_19015 [Bacillus cereus]
MPEDSLKVEYLVTVKANNDFCADIRGFNNFLQSNPHIIIDNKKISYKEIKANYFIDVSQLAKEKQRFFYIELRFDDIDRIEDFEQLLRVIKEVIYSTGNELTILWNDVSFYYSKKAYPLIFKVENLMRKLITRFMLTNVGLHWAKENIPAEVKNSVKDKDKDETPDFLYKINFIQLKDFLFKKYSPKSKSKDVLIDKIRSASCEGDLKLEELKSFVPSSNWEKYFSNLATLDEKYLGKKWDRLNELRNRIAHNTGLTRKEFNEVNTLTKKVSGTLQEAIDGLSTIVLSEADKDIVAEILDYEGGVIRFLEMYKVLDEIFQDIAPQIGALSNYNSDFSPLSITFVLWDRGFILQEVAEEMNQIIKFRNRIIHDSITGVDTSEIDDKIRQLQEIIIYLRMELAKHMQIN